MQNNNDMAGRIMAHAFNDEMEKISASKLHLSHLEDRMGFYLSDKDEQAARGLLKSEVGRRFVLRHPWLTGIPTLGLAPAIAKDQAYSKVMRKMLRGSPSLQKRHGNWLSETRNKRREDYEADTKRLKATETSRSASNIALAALTAQQAHYAEGKK